VRLQDRELGLSAWTVRRRALRADRAHGKQGRARVPLNRHRPRHGAAGLARLHGRSTAGEALIR